MTDLQPIKDRYEAATEGPWDYDGAMIWAPSGVIFKVDYEDPNADFIAHARTDIPILVAEVERLRAALEVATNEMYIDDGLVYIHDRMQPICGGSKIDDYDDARALCLPHRAQGGGVMFGLHLVTDYKPHFGLKFIYHWLSGAVDLAVALIRLSSLGLIDASSWSMSHQLWYVRLVHKGES